MIVWIIHTNITKEAGDKKICCLKCLIIKSLLILTYIIMKAKFVRMYGMSVTLSLKNY